VSGSKAICIELEVLQRGGQAAVVLTPELPTLDVEGMEDLEEAPDSEVEATEEEILDQATAAAPLWNSSRN